MNIQIEAKNIILTDAEKVSINQSVMANFSRLQTKIKSIRVYLADINGPKGGEDKQCTIIVSSNASAPVIIKEKQINTAHAARLALSRASKAFAAKSKRHLSFRKTSITQHIAPPAEIENGTL